MARTQAETEVDRAGRRREGGRDRYAPRLLICGRWQYAIDLADSSGSAENATASERQGETRPNRGNGENGRGRSRGRRDPTKGGAEKRKERRAEKREAEKMEDKQAKGGDRAGGSRSHRCQHAKAMARTQAKIEVDRAGSRREGGRDRYAPGLLICGRWQYAIDLADSSGCRLKRECRECNSKRTPGRDEQRRERPREQQRATRPN